MLDGNLQGPALGLAAHARFSVVTDRTRLVLAGAEFGFVPESFASYQLARLPGGLGTHRSLEPRPLHLPYMPHQAPTTFLQFDVYDTSNFCTCFTCCTC